MIWFNGTKLAPEDTTYSTPVVAPLAGQAALVFGSGDGGVWAFQPRTGKPIWSFQLSRRGINVSPVVENDKVVIAHAEENVDNPAWERSSASMARGKGDITKTGELWRAAGMDGKSSPLLVDGRVYCLDDGGKMYVVDATTGEEVCKPAKLIGTIVRSSPVYADGKIYICSTSAWHVFQPTRQGREARSTSCGWPKTTKSPARRRSRTAGFICRPAAACIAWARPTPSRRPIRSRPPAAESSGWPTTRRRPRCRSCPTTLLIQPGETRQLQARLFNARGQFLKETPATFSVDGPGEIDDTGKLRGGRAARLTRRRSSRPRSASWRGRRGSGSCRRCLGSSISTTARCRSPGSAPAIATCCATSTAKR